MTVQRRKIERKKKENKTKYSIFLVLILLISSIVGAVFYVTNSPSIDIVSGCDIEKVTPTMVVIIDRTGELTANHKRMLKNFINKEVNSLAVDTRLQIYTIDDKVFKGASKPIIDICKPKSKKDINKLYENVTIESKKTDVFNNKLELAINTAVLGKDGNSSPIIEAIYDVVSNSKLNDEIKVNRIMLVSDLIQHSELISFYNNRYDMKNIKLALDEFPSLRDVDINVLYLQRNNKEGKIQTPELLQWWENVFNIASANSLKVYKVR